MKISADRNFASEASALIFFRAKVKPRCPAAQNPRTNEEKRSWPATAVSRWSLSWDEIAEVQP